VSQRDRDDRTDGAGVHTVEVRVHGVTIVLRGRARAYSGSVGGGTEVQTRSLQSSSNMLREAAVNS
jgi:hypothetical protein